MYIINKYSNEHLLRVRVMVFNTTFNNISVISSFTQSNYLILKLIVSCIIILLFIYLLLISFFFPETYSHLTSYDNHI